MIIEPFNAGFIILILFTIILTIFLTLAVRKKSAKVKQTVIVCICVFCILLFFAYKLLLRIDAERFGMIETGEFSWLMELPLNLCKLNLFLIPIALMFKLRLLRVFCFFTAPIGAIMAMVSPENGYSGCSLFTPGVLYYYGTHVLLLAAGVLLATLGFCSPKYKDIPKVLGMFYALGTIIHGVNLLLNRVASVNANYFYTMDPNGAKYLELFWNMCPHAYWYIVLPTLCILIPYLFIVTGICVWYEHRNDKRMQDKIITKRLEKR